MRVMVIVKADVHSEGGALPTPELLTAMMKFNEDLVRAGVMVAGEGLKPSSQGVRVRFSGKERTVTAGPFPQVQELVAGFWIWEVDSVAAAVEWVKRCPNPTLSDSDIEIRPLVTMDDFAGVATPETEAQEQRLRAEMEAQRGKYV